MKRLAVIGFRGFPDVQGGVESHAQQLIPRLASDFDVRVYRRKPFLADSHTEAYPEIEFVDLPSTRIKGFEAFWHTFLCCLHLILHRVDVVNVHNIGPGMFTPLLRLFGMKVVLTYHSPNYEHAKWGRMAKLILRLSEKIALGCSNKVIFVSPKQMARYDDTVRRKSVAIANGITPIGHDNGTQFLDHHGILPKEYILAVGRLTPEKGFDHLIKAVNLCADASQLVIAGASDHDPSYLQYLKDLDVNGKVIFTGFTTGRDLAQLYTHARMYALSSLNEGFPMVLLEAMSHSLPIVSSDIPAAHIIELPQQNYAIPGNSQSLADAISRVMDSPILVDYDLSPYDWDKIARQTIDVYNSVLK